jgi:hypothetical protein
MRAIPMKKADATLRAASTAVIVVVSAELLRSFVFLRFGQLAFDSDQAITGLMAKHLVEGRAFPLFFYGQTYLLAVESWAAAPFFAVFGPTVTALRLSLLAWNIVFATLAILTLHRDSSLGLWAAIVPLLFFLLPPPSIAVQLMNAQGAIVEPYVFIAALWLLRKRPLWFGAVFAVGFRNREFVAYAIPALLLVEVLSGEIDRKRVRDWLIAGVAFAAVWQAVEALKPVADLMGPGTRGRFVETFPASQLTNLTNRFDFAPGLLPERIRLLAPRIAEWFAGARQVGSSLPAPEHPWIAAVAAAFAILASTRVAVVLLGPRGAEETRRAALATRVRKANFALYLMAAGLVAIAAFIAGRPALDGVARYVLVGLLFPIGLVASLLALEPIPALRRVAGGLVVVWALIMAGDHVALLRSYTRNPETNSRQLVADRLVSDGISTATAGYWDAYVITFLARERLTVASKDFVRIDEYQERFLERIATAVIISDRPCRDGTPVGRFYICSP